MATFHNFPMADLRTFIKESLKQHPQLKFKVDTITFDDDEARFVLKVHFKKEVMDLEKIAQVESLDLSKVHEDYRLTGYSLERDRDGKKPWRLRRVSDGKEVFAGTALVEKVFKQRPKKQEELK